ncbi:hypothetical protein JCGZ_01848 [Jatropha curcas]|uniref:Uncharacterized protein n=1 Tax=Jatropha curcas TaxID=180498 RepID=A0A067JSC4_JATCU|nr:hypothetical protein JCGZ_01848 [Jatropha curcas]
MGGKVAGGTLEASRRRGPASAWLGSRKNRGDSCDASAHSRHNRSSSCDATSAEDERKSEGETGASLLTKEEPMSPESNGAGTRRDFYCSSSCDSRSHQRRTKRETRLMLRRGVDGEELRWSENGGRRSGWC